MKNPTSKQTSSTVASYLYNLRFSQLDIKSNIRTLGNISVASLILASSGFLAYKVYSNFFSFSRGSNESSSIDGRKIRKDLNRKVAIVINKSLLYHSNVPFIKILQNVDLSVLILTPEVSFDEFTSLYRVPDEINFKLIPCDELSDVSHVLKQLKSDLVFLPNDFDYCKGLSIYIQEFIGAIVRLDSNPRQEILSFIAE